MGVSREREKKEVIFNLEKFQKRCKSIRKPLPSWTGYQLLSFWSNLGLDSTSTRLLKIISSLETNWERESMAV